ncbi:MAG: alanine--tRNA ligase [Saccharofermentanales bacterium]
MKSDELRNLYLKFFESKGHAVIASSSLVPENDPTVLFITAGMQPLVPYLLGEKHPSGRRLTDCQKCLRTDDIDDVGDSSHHTFFEMLGNWSLGDYFKEVSIKWSYEFLFSPEWLGLDKNRMAFTVFEGDENCPRDVESAEYWIAAGISPDRIFYLPAKENWWGPVGLTGPCGPDTEMFIDTGKLACSRECSPGCNCGKYIEFWNNVFMEYYKNIDGTFSPLLQKNVDTGMGLERILCIVNGKNDSYETDLFEDVIKIITELSGKTYGEDIKITKSFRIIADHLRSATFLLGDSIGITPSNTEQGYVLRRLIRRALRHMKVLGISEGNCGTISKIIIRKYGSVYPELLKNADKIFNELNLEDERFKKNFERGMKEFCKILPTCEDKIIAGSTAFRLYDTFGFPLEITVEMAGEIGYIVDTNSFNDFYKEQQMKSKAGSENRFKGGLADNSEKTARLHTATHILHYALRKLFGTSVEQRGSNINSERLRFDFSFSRKLDESEIELLEGIVNDIIKQNVAVDCEEMTLENARELGAIGLFENKYGDFVKVYSIGEYSKEICGGPHAASSGELCNFKIIKEESSASGIRRIKAVINF